MFRNSLVRRIAYRALVAGAIFLLCASSIYAKEGQMKQKAPIVVNGDRVEYFHDKKKVIGTGNISIDYEDVKLTCEKVTVYLDTREAIAEGNVKITQKDTYLSGDKMNYNFDTRVGKVIKGYVNYVPFYGKSQDIEKVSENQINIERGYITTCDLEKPHYRVRARQVRIYLDDKVIAKHILFYIGNCPIMYFPYYVQPLKEQSAHITAMAGHDKDWGYYLLTSLKFDYSEIFRGRFRFDYRAKNGLAYGIDNNYSLGGDAGAGDGIVKFYSTQENDKNLSYKRLTREELKYRLQVRHSWQVNEDTLAAVELNKVRDNNFMKYYFYKEWTEQRQPDSYASFITTKDDYTSTFLTRVRMDKYYDVIQRLPEYQMSIPQYNIKYNGKNSPLYYNFQSAAVYLNHAFAHTEGSSEPKDLDVIRLDTYNRLSYTAKLFKSLNVVPFAGTRQTYYSRNKWGDTNLIRGIFDSGFDSSIKFYKIYDINTNALGLDIHRLRHIITPTAAYSFTPQTTVSPDNLNQFDGVDSLDTQNHVLLSIENKLQTKRGGPDNMSAVDIVDFIISADYLFRLKDNNLAFKQQKFKSVDMQLELTPYPWLYALSKMRINTNQGLPELVSIDFVGGKEADRTLSFGYRYEQSFDPAGIVDTDTGKNLLNYLTTDVIYRINELWKAHVYWRFNMNRGFIDEHQYTISRDLHCWILDFTIDLRPYLNDKTISEQIFWVALRLKAFPRLPLGISRNYSYTRAGRPGDPGYIQREKFGAGRAPAY